MDTHSFSQLVFQLTNSAIELPPDAHQKAQINILRNAIPFDAAWWGWSNFGNGRNKLVNTGLFGLPRSFESAVRAVLHLDPFVQTGRNLAVFGKSLEVQSAPLPDEFRKCLEAFQITSVLNGHCRLQGNTEFNFFLSLYKRDSNERFSTAETADYRFILRHIEQCLSLALRAELRSLAPEGGETALISAGGAIVRATSRFQDRLAQEVSGTAERQAILSDLSFGRAKWTGAQLVLTGAPYKQGLVLVRLAATDVLACLSIEERRVADYLTQGLTMREIAATRGVAHNTVRNQVATIYRKIGVKNRATFMTRSGAG
ncbi:helix-turn-helix transcriptional regulator [Neptunicoccus cionae]|uniref:helix-turn-helix transcriptional regulator n=1 Tax=Neptunicoccus cionae TaxID=2035344 RepID=UPI000C77F5A9|nr:helix-turn-helix transcriptional regulator [Amylibacter cionae]PLS20978.1 LuxR family transcriptional regulator [Amylibacter cionae]